MTAINIIQQSSRIVILTDGAFYDGNGVLTGIAPKTHLLPHVNAAISFRGSCHLAPVFVERVCAFNSVLQSFDDLLLAAQILIERLDIVARPNDYDPAVDIFISGWSDDHQRLATYMISTHDRYDGLTPFRLVECGEIVTTPTCTNEQLAHFGWINPASPDEFDPAVDGLRLLWAQRQVTAPMDGRYPDGVQGHGVGGFIQLTTVSRNAMSTAILHRWPDKIGERVSPAPADVTPLAQTEVGAAAAVPAVS